MNILSSQEVQTSDNKSLEGMINSITSGGLYTFGSSKIASNNWSRTAAAAFEVGKKCFLLQATSNIKFQDI